MTQQIHTVDDVLSVLRSRISELGLSHLDVDHRAGLSDGHTSSVLCGNRVPKSDTLLRLFAAVDLHLMSAPRV